jgi:hypothetical protein
MVEARSGGNEVSSPDMTVAGDVARSGEGRLQEELERLVALRSFLLLEIDGDIEVLKRARDIVGHSSFSEVGELIQYRQ